MRDPDFHRALETVSARPFEADGREFEIDRKFGKEDSRIIIRSASGEDVTCAYELQRNGEVLFARSHLDLPRELFESVAMIRETQLSELGSSDTIRGRIANLAQFGDEELSVGQSLSSLQEALAAEAFMFDFRAKPSVGVFRYGQG